MQLSFPLAKHRLFIRRRGWKRTFSSAVALSFHAMAGAAQASLICRAQFPRVHRQAVPACVLFGSGMAPLALHSRHHRLHLARHFRCMATGTNLQAPSAELDTQRCFRIPRCSSFLPGRNPEQMHLGEVAHPGLQYLTPRNHQGSLTLHARSNDPLDDAFRAIRTSERLHLEAFICAPI